MSDWFDSHHGMVVALTYAVAVIANWLCQRIDFKRNPLKQQRYRLLPLGYKPACWLIVLPLLAFWLVIPVFGVLGMITLLALEGRCVRWYRRAGLL